MPENDDSYKQIFKATSIFGGVQVFNILISIVSSKVVALLLGPIGMGIVSLLNSTIGMVGGFTEFGLRISAVKNVATAAESNDQDLLGKTVKVFRLLVWFTGSLGLIITLILAPQLSDLAFGNRAYSVSFMLLSIILLFTQVNTGQSVILQGLRKIHYLAKASVLGSLIGLIISLPLYYFLREKGIVPALILISFSTLILSRYYARKVHIPKANVTKSFIINESKSMLKMGFIISISSLINIASTYLIRIYISKQGSVAEVGLFTAGFAIISTYVGMIFTAMSTDYYPRLAGISNDNIKCKKAINEQAEVAILLLAPILVIFLVFIKIGILLLYSQEFLGVVDMVLWAALGIFFKALGWAIAYIFLAKSASKAYFINEVIANLYMLIINIIGYQYYGLTGLGFSFLVGYIIYFIQIYYVSRKLYDFKIDYSLCKIFIIHFALALICFIAVYFLIPLVSYSVGIIIILISSTYSLTELNKRLNLKDLFIRKFKKI